jgi:hypothetical protein
VLSLPPKNNLKHKMNTGLQILSDLTIFSKYANFLPETNRREDWKRLFLVMN